MLKKSLAISLVVLQIFTRAAWAVEFQPVTVASTLQFSSDILKNENLLSVPGAFSFLKISVSVINQPLAKSQGLSVFSGVKANKTLTNSSSWSLTTAYYANAPSLINVYRSSGNPSSNSSPLSKTKDGILLGINSGCHLCSSQGSSISDAVIDDALGSVRQITNAAGTITETYDYDVYGKPLNTSTVGNPVMFTGRWFDSESGNFYYRARYYQPTLGRFLQRDPIGYLDGMNLYSYVKNNPIVFLDALGLDAHHIIPQKIWRNLPLNPKVKNILKNTTIEAGRHFFTGPHRKYSDLVQGLWDEAFHSLRAEDITESMINDFIKRTRANPEVDDLLKTIIKEGTERCALNRASKAVGKFVPFVGTIFFIYDVIGGAIGDPGNVW